MLIFLSLLHHRKKSRFSDKNRAKNFLFSRSTKRSSGGGGGKVGIGRDTANNCFMDGLMGVRCGLKFRHSV